VSAKNQKSADVWMPWYIRDYLGDTTHLTAAQHGAYLLLLARYWINRGPLPDDDAFLANTARMTAREWARNRPTIQAFFIVEGGKWSQKRADAEIQKSDKNCERQSDAGRKAAASRWHKNGHANRMPDACAPHSDRMLSGITNGQPLDAPSPSPSPSPKEDDSSPTSSQVTIPRDVVVESSEPQSLSSEILSQIESVWSVWPKRIDVMAAKLAIGHAIQRHGFPEVLEGTRSIVAAEAETRSSPPGRFLPKPTEFFENSRYLDDPAQYGPRGATQNPGAVRQRIDELAKQIQEHPGNPVNTEGSLDRKEKFRDEFLELKRQLATAKASLANLQNS
jgi:uncharacterized protein YdaU (DUF1376 family)